MCVLLSQAASLEMVLECWADVEGEVSGALRWDLAACVSSYGVQLLPALHRPILESP